MQSSSSLRDHKDQMHFRHRRNNNYFSLMSNKLLLKPLFFCEEIKHHSILRKWFIIVVKNNINTTLFIQLCPWRFANEFWQWAHRIIAQLSSS